MERDSPYFLTIRNVLVGRSYGIEFSLIDVSIIVPLIEGSNWDSTLPNSDDQAFSYKATNRIIFC